MICAGLRFTALQTYHRVAQTCHKRVHTRDLLIAQFSCFIDQVRILVVKILDQCWRILTS